MATFNKVMLIGRLTNNPDPPRVLPNSGSTLVKFGFAVGRSKKNPQTGQWESDPNTLFIDCEVFTRPDATFRLCDIVSQYCTKGSQIFVEGRLQLDTWDDKNNPGQKRSKHKLVVEGVQLLDTRGGAQGGGGQDGGYGSYGGAPAGGGRSAPPPAGNRGGGGQNFGPDDHDMGGGSPDGGEIPF